MDGWIEMDPGGWHPKSDLYVVAWEKRSVNVCPVLRVRRETQLGRIKASYLGIQRVAFDS
jgi:hypothetical protein